MNSGLAVRGGVPNSGPAPTAPERALEPVTRRYRPDAAALDELVEALYQLLVNAPGDPQTTTPTPVDSACLSAPHE